MKLWVVNFFLCCYLVPLSVASDYWNAVAAVGVATMFSSVLFERAVLFPELEEDWGTAEVAPGEFKKGFEDLCFFTLIVTGISGFPFALEIVAFGDIEDERAPARFVAVFR